MRFLYGSALLLIACVGAFAAPGVGVFVDFEAPPSERAMAAMELEVASIMRPAGLQFSWHNVRENDRSDSFADLIVVRFKGSCQGTSLPDPSIVGSLASTSVSEGHVLHFAEVRCDELRRYLSHEMTAVPASERSELYGQALGRILAHEMYHMLAGTEKHASGGVARACHSRKELVQTYFGFDPEETGILREYADRILPHQPQHAINAGGN